VENLTKAWPPVTNLVMIEQQ